MFSNIYQSSVFVMLTVGLLGVLGDQFENCVNLEVFDCNSRNPCTQRQPNDNFYFSHDDPTKFVQCDNSDRCFSMNCAQGTVWSQLQLTCIGGTAVDAQ